MVQVKGKKITEKHLENASFPTNEFPWVAINTDLTGVYMKY